MALYHNIATGEIRDLSDALITNWISSGNPKAQQWEPYIPPPPQPPPPPPPDWLKFAGWLFSFPPMAAAMATARASSSPQGEPATTSLPAAMDEARLRSNYVPFALGWAQFLAAAQMPPAALAAIVTEAEADRLPPEFIAALQPTTPAPTP